MKKFHHYNSGGNRAQYKWSSAPQNPDINSVHKVYVNHTTNSNHVKHINQHQKYSAAPSNGLTSQHHKPNHPSRHPYSHTKFVSGSRPNKYVFVSNSIDKKTIAKPPTVSKLPVQHTNNVIQCRPTKKFTGSRNDVFRFTSVPKPVNSTANIPKNSDMIQECHKKTSQPEATNVIASSKLSIVHQQKFNKRKKPGIVPSRSQLKWTSQDNINTTKLPAAVVNSKPKLPCSAITSNRPSLKQLPSTTTRSRFTWRRSSSETPRRRSSSNLSNHVVNTRYKMIRSSPVISKKIMHRRTSHSSGRKIVYIGGVAYNATARRLSRRLSSGSSKRKLLAKGVIKKAGNRVWVANGSTDEPADESFAHPGYEIRRKKGNRQWIAGNKSILVRQANAIKHKYAACKSQLISPGKHRANFLKVFIKNDVFIMDPSKRTLRRLSRTSLGSDSRRKIIGSVPSRTPTHQLANHAVRRSKTLVWHAARKKKNVPKSEQYCMFFNRFGKCSRQDICPYIHDPDKIAVCTRFLRGTCDKTDGTCPFSHHITKEKMPVCSYFLRGVCTKDACPYLHVYVGENAEICQDFVKGFCPNGDKCDKKHVLDCPDFSVSGKCSKGDKCPLRHRKRVHKRRSSFAKTESSKEPKAFKRRRVVNQPVTNKQRKISDCNTTDTLITPDQLEFIPLEQGPSTPPDFIAL